MYMENIKNIINEMGLDCKMFVFGRGCQRSSGGKNRKPRYKIKSISISQSDVVYIVQFCKDIGQYIIWKKTGNSARTDLSVIAEDVPIVKGDEIAHTLKGIEFVWGKKEAVYTFREEGIKKFLKKYIS